MPTNVRDPRTIITPDAFGIAPELMGTPLAPPWRRFWALMVDLVVILVLTAMLDEIAVFVWGIVGLFFMRVAFARPSKGTGQAATTLLRVFTGCLGLVILSGVGVVWLIYSLADDPEDQMSVPGVVTEVGEEAQRGGLGNLLDLVGGGFSALADLREAETAEEAEEATLEALHVAGDLGVDEDGLEELLDGVDVEGVPWEGEAEEIFARALGRWREATGRGEGAEEVGMDADEVAAVAEVAALDDETVLVEYARILREGGARSDEEVSGSRAFRIRALRTRALELLATDTLEALQDEVADLEEELEEQEARRREAEVALEESGSPMVELLRDIWDQLGSAIGLWSIYFTILLTLWKGQTVGKRLMGLRVVRLDGEAMTWWSAFERAGGYIAGLATGLLGFAQVFWDANRQCIHDKIVGTVVVDTRASPDPDALAQAWEAGPQPDTGTS